MIVDALFGFSFKGPLRQPYEDILKGFKDIEVPIFSIDNPSGWEIDNGKFFWGVEV